MKKIIFIALFFLMAFKSAYAQSHADYYPVYSVYSPKFGITASTQFSNFHDGYYDSDFQFGFSLGAVYRFPVSKGLSIEPQLMYSRKGGMDNYHINGFYYGSVRFKLHYIEAPIQLNIRTKGIVDIIIGGYAGYLVDATFDLSAPYFYGYGELDDDEFEELDLGLIAGVGFNLPFGKISIKYNHGFTDVAKNGNSYLFLEGAKNSVISISYTRYFK